MASTERVSIAIQVMNRVTALGRAAAIFAALLLISTVPASGQGNTSCLSAPDGDPTNSICASADGNLLVNAPAYNIPAYIQVQGTAKLTGGDRKTVARYSVDPLGEHLGITVGENSAELEPAVQPALSVTRAGNVGIGTSAPSTQLDIIARAADVPVMFQMGGSLKLGPGDFRKTTARYVVDPTKEYLSIAVGENSGELATPGLVITRNRRIGIGVTNPSSPLHVNGTTTTSILQITGGADLAEPFAFEDADSIQPGMVVAIDPNTPGQLRLASRAYDRGVAGVVSGAGGIQPGMIMQQTDLASENDLPVALTGRVYVWADASYGAIEPSDLLTTSATPGHAMKVEDYERSHGAILGKAMTGLDEGVGLVLVLVALQ